MAPNISCIGKIKDEIRDNLLSIKKVTDGAFADQIFSAGELQSLKEIENQLAERFAFLTRAVDVKSKVVKVS